MPQTNPTNDFQHLTAIEKIELIGQLWDSLADSQCELPMPDWHREELERRLADAEVNPQASMPWSDVKQRLRQRP